MRIKPCGAFTILLLLVVLTGAQAMGMSAAVPGFRGGQSMRDPSAVYCANLGYEYATVASPDGGQHGICRLPDGAVCSAWSFLNGQCGRNHSICARTGLDTVVLSDGHNPFSWEYAVCVDSHLGLVESVVEMANLVADSATGWGPESMPLPADPQLPHDTGPRAQTAPSSFDWRDHNGADWMSPVKSQGICGSCWAFSAVGVAEAVINIASNDANLDLDLSEQYLVTDCAPSAGACDGGSKKLALEYIRDSGVPDEACLPYHDGEPITGCTYAGGVCDTDLCTYHTAPECSDYRCTDRCSDWASRLHTLGGVTYMGYDPPADAIKEALIAYGPVAVSMNMGGSWNEDKVYTCPSNTDTGHAVILVGYDDPGGYWIVKNSWGPDWGPEGNGYFKVAYDNCAIQKYPIYAGATFRTFLPLVMKNFTPGTVQAGIYGRVAESGSPAGAVGLTLMRLDVSSWSTFRTTSTASDGTYRFTGLASLGPGQKYAVRYMNPTCAGGRLNGWWCWSVNSYTSGMNVHGGDFDIANVTLVSPGDGATVSLPYAFYWNRRAATPSDDYEFNLYDPADWNPSWYTDPPLGYVDSYTLSSLPVGFSYGAEYEWAVWVYGPQGAGIPCDSRLVTFGSPTEVGIYGTVTEDGLAATGVTLDLRYYAGSSWSTKASTTTDSNGHYLFAGVPSLGSGESYSVRYRNTSATPGRLYDWHTPSIDSYTTGTNLHAGDFDIADIVLVSPEEGATVSLPHTFYWTPRPATPTDDYEFDLYDGEWWWTDPTLGYVGQYTLNSLPSDFYPDTEYWWEVWVYGPYGYGYSYEYRSVTFSSTGLESGETPALHHGPPPRDIADVPRRR